MEKTSITLKPCSERNGDLPVELLSVILSRVFPVRSLVQWRCVSKRWKALIDDPVFARLHLDYWNSMGDESRLFVVQNPSSRAYECVLRSAKSFSTVENLAVISSTLPGLSSTLPPIDNDDGETGHWEFFSMVDGMVMLANLGFKFGLMLWNPSIRKARRLPPCPGITNRSKTQHFGFGFDPSSQDYNYVVLVYETKSVMQSYAIYSVGSNSWKIIECQDQYFTQVLRCSFDMATCVGGVLYQQPGVSLDLRTETFSPVEYPDLGLTVDRSKLTTADCGRCLSLVEFTPNNGYVRVMQEGGLWTQRYKFPLVYPTCGVKLWNYYARFLHLTAGGEVFMDWANEVITCYSIETGDQRVLLQESLRLSFVQPYKESLLLLLN